MEGENKHTMRLAIVLAFMVVALVTVSIDAFQVGGEDEQQASVLRVYAQ